MHRGSVHSGERLIDAPHCAFDIGRVSIRDGSISVAYAGVVRKPELVIPARLLRFNLHSYADPRRRLTNTDTLRAAG